MSCPWCKINRLTCWPVVLCATDVPLECKNNDRGKKKMNSIYVRKIYLDQEECPSTYTQVSIDHRLVQVQWPIAQNDTLYLHRTSLARCYDHPVPSSVTPGEKNRIQRMIHEAQQVSRIQLKRISPPSPPSFRFHLSDSANRPNGSEGRVHWTVTCWQFVNLQGRVVTLRYRIVKFSLVR